MRVYELQVLFKSDEEWTKSALNEEAAADLELAELNVVVASCSRVKHGGSLHTKIGL